ncbi:MAG: hypothetical protein FWG34_13970 [Oscillospiraceae bacterium]|nr:hypothetical protein [Oscillospiraceae bacterium]
MKKRKLSLLAVICAASLAFVACGGDGANADADKKAENAEQVETNNEQLQETTDMPDNLPERDFGGYRFRLYMRGGTERQSAEFYMEGETGDIMDDAKYSRRIKVEERFGIKIDEMSYDYNDPGASAAQKSILAGDDAFDLLGVHGASMAAIAQKEYLLDWIENMPYVNFAAPWWPDDEAKSMRIGGKLYFTIGELTYANTSGAACMLFNKELFKDLSIDYPYADVTEGTWTLDKFVSVAKLGILDLNGDGKMAPEDDRYGLEIYHDTVYPVNVFFCGGDKIITVRDDGRLDLTAYSDRTISIFEKFFDMIKSDGACFQNWTKYPDGMNSAFRNGRALFYAGLMMHIITHRDLEIEFGVVPVPKYEQSTPKYYANSYLGSQVFGVPITAADTERISIIVEALSAEGYRILKPAYYEEALKRKFSRDEESESMIDYIRDGIVFEFAQYFGNIGGNFSFLGQQLLSQKEPNFASFYEKNEAQIQKNIDKANEEYGYDIN